MEHKDDLTADELQADDEMSPRPTRNERSASTPDEADDDNAPEAPRPAVSE